MRETFNVARIPPLKCISKRIADWTGHGNRDWYEAKEKRRLNCGHFSGRLTAPTFLTELGDMNRFRNRRQLESYWGLAPLSYESGRDASPGNENLYSKLYKSNLTTISLAASVLKALLETHQSVLHS